MSASLIRHWHLLKQIPRYPGKIDTAALERELAAEGFSVSRRTIERDLQQLSEYFVIEADTREKPYGWSWGQSVKGLDIPGMTMSQAVTFTLTEVYLTPLLPSAMRRHLQPFFEHAHAVLRNINAEAARKWAAKVRVIQPTQTLIPPCVLDAVQETVYDALFADRQLALSYLKKGASVAQERVVSPLGLIQRGQIMYLICVDCRSIDPMALAIHRIKSAERLPEAAMIPDGFDLDKAIADGLLAFKRSPITTFEAVFDREAASHLLERPLSEDQTMVDVDSEHVRVTATLPDSEQLKWWLLGFGVKVEVIKPETLRNRIADIVNGLHKIYGGPASTP